MLLEALNFAATYLISPRKRAGEINSSVTLWARARRCSKDWAQHEANSKAFILQAIDTLPQRRVAVVLGSGLLRDVPIEALSKRFREVRLYDLQHLASVRAWTAMRGLRNLSFENRDLSGYRAGAGPLAFLQSVPDIDLVISANLLSQIGVGISRLVKSEPGLPEDSVARLIEAHIDGLSALAARTCLITDVSYEVIDRSGKVLERDDLMHGVTLPAHQLEWQWPVAPLGELDPNYRAVHRVMATMPAQASPARPLP
ncbi:MAG: hypothetical protein JWM58_2026 [Rhizobium sp.]|nr:hypothetical protein [Rhizobium sp.]